MNSHAYYGASGLRFWDADAILAREQAVQTLVQAMTAALTGINQIWTFHRMEGPILTPRSRISPEYGDDDLFITQAKHGDQELVLRAETTASTYLFAEHLLKTGVRPPVCVYQSGLSFRRETNDGARASELRFNQFYQLEFQCLYNHEKTKANYREAVEPAIAAAIKRITHAPDVRLVDSDRLPSYSLVTRDVEVPFPPGDKWKEMCSISTRNDFPDPALHVLEVAIGLDRLISVEDVIADRTGVIDHPLG